MKMEIRKATKKDFNSVLKLERMWEKEGISWSVKHPGKKELIKHLTKDFVYLAISGEKFLGHIIALIKKADKILDYAEIKKNEKFGYIDGVYVVPRYRKLGIGKLLVKKIISDFKKQKIKKIVLKATSKKLKQLESFYNKLGFESKFVDIVMRIR